MMGIFDKIGYVLLGVGFGGALVLVIGSYVGVGAKLDVPTVPVSHAAMPIHEEMASTVVPSITDTTGEQWKPVEKDVDFHDKALQTLSELDGLVKSQAMTLQQAREEYALLKASMKKTD